MSRCHQIWNRSTTKKVRLLLGTSITFFVVLRFQIWLHLDIFSQLSLFQKYHQGLKNVNNNKGKFLTHTRTWSNQLLKILLMKMFSNHSDFCFHITIHKILDKKSLYGRKNFISEKKIITKNFENKPTFFKIITEERWWRNFLLTFLEST